MSAPKKCWFHRWAEVGYDGFLSLIDECEKCQWQRVFNGALNETFICPPGTYRRRP